ncbi:MAG TPA: hypothetical protein VGI39_35730 [Polyangiaceae bacterium]
MRWYAKISSGDVAAMTLDELDAAYERGVVDADTLVLAPEAAAWVKLGELAALSESPSPEGDPPAVHDEETLLAGANARPRGKWTAPIAVGSVAALVFLAAAVEATRAGALFHRSAPIVEAHPAARATNAGPSLESRETPAPLGSTAAALLPIRVAPAPNPKRSAPRPTRPAAVGSAAVFTSGGHPNDPLNADLP